MYGAYRQLLTGAQAVGLSLFVNYVYTERFGNNPYGDFGALSYQDEPVANAPKYRALLDAALGTLFRPAHPRPAPMPPPNVGFQPAAASVPLGSGSQSPPHRSIGRPRVCLSPRLPLPLASTRSFPGTTAARRPACDREMGTGSFAMIMGDGRAVIVGGRSNGASFNPSPEARRRRAPTPRLRRRVIKRAPGTYGRETASQSLTVPSRLAG